MSWIVEKRVLQLYPAYLERATNPDVKRVLQRILAQEARHGVRFDAITYPEGVRARLTVIESRLWSEVLEQVEAYLDGADPMLGTGAFASRLEGDVSATD